MQAMTSLKWKVICGNNMSSQPDYTLVPFWCTLVFQVRSLFLLVFAPFTLQVEMLTWLRIFCRNMT